MSCCNDGFRLAGPPSEYSLRSKAQIDALFEDSRSICSSTLGGWYASISNDNHLESEDLGNEEQTRVNSAVQARIEAMFASVEAETGTPGECTAAILSVKYMGAAPVGGRVTSVRGLQEPLRQLLERIEGSVKAELEISRRGLTYRVSEVCERNNPFRRIAVWSALRLRRRRTNSGEIHHALLPLVGDQDLRGQPGDFKHADLYRTMRGLKTDVTRYPPIFAVVMRKPGAARLLECHAFACQSEEDAIVAAATLYRALLADMDANRRRPRHANGVGRISLASVTSSVRDTSPSRNNIYFSVPSRSLVTTIPSHPIRPPRTRKKSLSSSTTGDEYVKMDVQKVSRRRKTNKSDVKAEDILEARDRMRDSIEDSHNKYNKSEKSNWSWEISKRDIQTEENVNKYEQLPLKNETNINSTERISHDPTDNYAIQNRSNSIYASPRNHVNSEKPENSNIYDIKTNTQTTSFESVHQRKTTDDEFKDVNKIYTLGQEDMYNTDNDKMRKSNNHTSRLKTMKDHLHRRIGESSKEATMNFGTRLSRMNRSNSNAPDSKTGGPRMRRRSRADSEPPVSRSEKIINKQKDIKLKRSQSDLDVDRGDLMTRVELPRRGSFLKTGNARRQNNITGGTPLGFTELFDEFRNQEGLTSVDDILATIIDPEGMSFNDLKPLYKEFLLKLAATLTQDELYQRSASIMRRRRRPQRRRSVRRPCLLGRAIKRSVSRLKGSGGPTEFTSVLFPAKRLNDSLGSSSSCDIKGSHRNHVMVNRLGRRRSSWSRSKTKALHTTSEDSDTCKRLNRNLVGANRSSSGYVSCSECSYDSESCTCISADKCYCSLRKRVPNEQLADDTGICACDTDSCSESNKCYCPTKTVQPTILEQLRQKGIVPSDTSLSRAGTPEKTKQQRKNRSHSSSRSVETLQPRVLAPGGSSDNLALDYDLFSPGRRPQPSLNSEKVLVVSARDTQGRLVYVGGADGDKKLYTHVGGRSDTHHEALSIKKSAEIAAVFGADSDRIGRRASNCSSLRSSISLEAGLGYLP